VLVVRLIYPEADSQEIKSFKLLALPSTTISNTSDVFVKAVDVSLTP
jgi:hypothetical protein